MTTELRQLTQAVKGGFATIKVRAGEAADDLKNASAAADQAIRDVREKCIHPMSEATKELNAATEELRELTNALPLEVKPEKKGIFGL